MKKDVIVPLLSWLTGSSRIGGSYNIYSGSLGTDPKTGALSSKIFNYRIWPEKLEDETEVIKTAVYYGMLCFEKQKEDEVEKNCFPFSNEGLEEIKVYLQGKADEFFA